MRWFLLAASTMVLAWTGVLGASVLLNPGSAGDEPESGMDSVETQVAEAPAPDDAREMEAVVDSAPVETPPVETPAEIIAEPQADVPPPSPPPPLPPPPPPPPPAAVRTPTPAPVEAPPAEPAPLREAIPEVFLRMPIADRDRFLPEAYSTEILPAIRAGEVSEIRIEAHGDGTGEREDERALTQGWANAMRDWLISEGVDPDVIAEVAGHGGDRPLEIVQGGRASFINQRIEVRVAYEDAVMRYLGDEE
ncbi:MAG: hypothetical protein ACK46Q_01440 [Hyphomonas sp.]